jgi:hypothetical protein
MTDPKYIADREIIANEIATKNVYSSKNCEPWTLVGPKVDPDMFDAAVKGYDAGYSRANSELENLKQLIEAKDAAWDVLEKHEALVIKALDVAVEALKFYGNRKNWTEVNSQVCSRLECPGDHSSEIAFSGKYHAGHRARTAQSEIQGLVEKLAKDE